jgi:acetyltransferase-like isoleucine patch superfamily enzyme
MKEYIIKVIRRIFKSPLSIPNLLFSILICKIRSKYYTSKIDGGGGKIIITKPFINFKINKHKTSELSIKGRFRIIPHFGGNSPSVISMGINSKLEVNGDFMIGQGVTIALLGNSILTIGGKDLESDSGITADTKVLVYKKIEIGKDFICAWNVLITDSDWHQIIGQDHQADVHIGDHVWIANSNNILKGSNIGNNCIVASNSKIMNKIFPDNVLIGGIPPKILKANISWNRDI